MIRKALLFLCLLAIASPVLAQRDAIEILRSDFRTNKTAALTDALDLTEAESAAFWPIYREYEGAYSKIGDKRIALIQQYAANYDTMTDVVTKDLVKQSFALQQERLNLLKKYCGKIEKGVSVKVAGRWMQCENAINSIVDAQIASELPLLK